MQDLTETISNFQLPSCRDLRFFEVKDTARRVQIIKDRKARKCNARNAATARKIDT